METEKELKEKVCAFKENFFSKEAKNLKDKDKLLDFCIKKAWADAMQRERFKGRKNSEILQNSEAIKKQLKNEIERGNYASDFDSWHKKTCGNSNFNMGVGLWQKFINMTFKYLYCVREYFSGIDFTFCHCPIDSVIAKKLREKMKKGETGYELVDSIANSGKTNWNNIDYTQYLQFEEIVKGKTQPGMSKLAFDFLNWDNSKS